jgi:hypothetical protein
VEEYFRSVEIKQPLSLWSRIERLAWGAPIWQFAIRNVERRIERLIDRSDEHGAKTRRRLRAYCLFIIRVDDYGRLLSRAARTQIRGFRDAGASKTLIRDAVIGRLLDRLSGQTEMAEWRSRLVLALGVIWHALTMVSAAVLLTLVVALPGAALMKLVVSGVLVVFFVFSIAFINALTIRQFFARPKLAVFCDAMKPPVTPQLRAVS